MPMATWTVNIEAEAMDDLRALDKSIRQQVLRDIKKKLATNPVDYGDPLGVRNGMDLTGAYALRVVRRSIRIVYEVNSDVVTVYVFAVGRREDMDVYRTAFERMQRHRQ